MAAKQPGALSEGAAGDVVTGANTFGPKAKQSPRLQRWAPPPPGALPSFGAVAQPMPVFFYFIDEGWAPFWWKPAGWQ